MLEHIKSFLQRQIKCLLAIVNYWRSIGQWFEEQHSVISEPFLAQDKTA